MSELDDDDAETRRNRDQAKLKKCSYDKANIFSKYYLTFFIPTILLARKRLLQLDDIEGPPAEAESKLLAQRLEATYFGQIGRRPKPSFFRALLQTFGPQLIVVLMLEITTKCFLSPLQILTVGSIIRETSAYTRILNNNNNTDENNNTTNVWLSDEERSLELNRIYWSIFSSTAIILSCSWLISACSHPGFYRSSQIAMKWRIASCALIYRKVLRLSQDSLAEVGKGRMINLISNDLNRFDECLQNCTNLITAPIQSIIILIILALKYLGIWTTLVSVLSLLVFLVIQSSLGKGFGKVRRLVAMKTDERVRLLNDIIVAIRIIKMYAWEEAYMKLVNEARSKEIRLVGFASALKAINMTIFFSSSKLFVFIILMTFILLGNKIGPELTFVTIGMSGLIRLSLTNHFPQGIANLAETLVSCSRIDAFLRLNEFSRSSAHYRRERVSLEAGRLVFERVSANWNWINSPESMDEEREWEDDDNCVLRALDITIESGQLVMVVGRVGAGKSSVLQGILGELPVASGCIRIAGRLSYAAQESWIFPGSVRDNILFGAPMRRERYEQIIKCCCLERDLRILAQGDKTLVGERGVSLSGGQKARVNLARAIYQEADIYLLDDPLSAVDAPVARDIFREAIETFLKGKTVLLATHQLQFIDRADRLLVMRAGKLAAYGTWDQLRATLDEEDLELSHYMKRKSDLEEAEDEASRLAENEAQASQLIEGDPGEVELASKKLGKIRMDLGAGSKQGSESLSSISADWQSYVYYGRHATSLTFGLFFLLLCIVCQTVEVYNDFFLSLWTDSEQRKQESAQDKITFKPLTYVDSLSIGQLIGVYSTIIIGLFVLTFSKTIGFYKSTLQASRNIHAKLIDSIMGTQVGFFDFNPIGLFLNRVCRDIGYLDELLPLTLFMVFNITLGVGGALVLVTFLQPMNAIPTAILLALALVVRQICSYALIRTKQIEGVTRTPVFSHLSVTLDGLSTIRALGVERDFRRLFDQYQDTHSGAWFTYLTAGRFLSYIVETMTIGFITIVISFQVLVNLGSSNAASVGLLITAILWVPMPIQWGMRQLVELESQMTSVQRIKEYSNLEREPDCGPTDERSYQEQTGTLDGPAAIEFVNVNLSYFTDESLVLKDLNLRIGAAEKVGVVGRTGAGKSSLVAVLFRLYPYEGTIRRAGLDTKLSSLRALRSSMSIIPQDPVLFGGDLRQNLDPFGEHSDAELWEALDAVRLKPLFVAGGGLSSKIQSSGANLSVGQRQLICLARAILRSNKILILDEATANVDPETDAFIQATIRQRFKDCTVLTIAHRLNTIVDSDRVLVMEAGEAREFDTPARLASVPTSLFSRMLDSNPSRQAARLRELIKARAED